MCDTLIALGKEGKSLAQMAAALDITRETLFQWEKSNPQISYALKRAREFSQAWWDNLGQKGASGGVEGFNATAYVWQTKNRFPKDYRDKHEIEHSGELSVEVVIGGEDE